ncbi:MAG: hypothetical protein GY926_03080 [bacterium]|nr:hypothetical protein [bacterium]
MLAIGFNTGPLVVGLGVGALGLGLLSSTRFRTWGLVALAAFVLLMATALFSAPSEYEAEALVSPEAHPVAVDAYVDGYRVTVDIGDCLTLYRVDGSEWQPTLFDVAPGDKWDGKAEEFCTMSLRLDETVSLPDQIMEGSWGLCSGSLCYTLENP